MTPETHPIVNLSDESLEVMLKSALRNILILGALASVVVFIGSGWRNGAMLVTGTLISAASVLEWRHLIRVVNARLNEQRTPANTNIVVLFLVLRLAVFAGAIYVSLKCFHGSVVALLSGLALAVLAVGWEVMRLLRD
jgi:hypothetical protein